MGCTDQSSSVRSTATCKLEASLAFFSPDLYFPFLREFSRCGGESLDSPEGSQSSRPKVNESYFFKMERRKAESVDQVVIDSDGKDHGGVIESVGSPKFDLLVIFDLQENQVF